MIYNIGLTGGIGSGKSTVARFFTELNVPVFSADEIGFELSQKGAAGYDAIVAEFGNKVLLADGELNRAALGDIIFSNDTLKARLETILHPLILQTMHQRAEAEDTPYCVLDIPLLINTAERDKVNRILVVQCDRGTRIARIKHRSGWSVKKIEAVMAGQVSEQALIDAADDLIDNNRATSDLKPQVIQLHQRYTALAS